MVLKATLHEPEHFFSARHYPCASCCVCVTGRDAVSMLPDDRLVRLHLMAPAAAVAAGAKRRRAWRLFFLGGGWWRMKHDDGEGAGREGTMS